MKPRSPVHWIAAMALIASTAVGVYANNISVTHVRLRGQDESAGVNNPANFRMVRFDLAWENSWRTSTLESNWDAAWVFVKYRMLNGDTWHHATLDHVGHLAPAGSEIVPSGDGRGVFIQRNANGIGHVSWPGVELRWRYALDGLNDYDSVQVCVFAIEMVYVPQGSFLLGDGATTGVRGNFTNANTTAPFRVTSEAEITLGGGGAGSLGNNNAAGMNAPPDDFNSTTTQTLPAAFPKGYRAFYAMKYPITQEQYVEFLNRLTRTQQATRRSGVAVGFYHGNAATPQNRNGIKLMADPGGTSPRVYGNDLNNNGIAGEMEDGQHIAVNFLSKADLLAYLDWAGLRPLTEMEYEKACRGHVLNAVPGEFAWGTTNITPALGVLNSGMPDEVPTNPGANANHGMHLLGPVRVGAFAKGATSRQMAGATYYGILEMSHNLWQPFVPVGTPQGRLFTGNHGDGTLAANGDPSVADWPTVAGAGLGVRGGWFWLSDPEFGRVSNRGSANWPDAGRHNFLGGRGGRTAP